MKISIVCFNLSNNATVRAHLLARLLAPKYQVSVVGPQFGPELWKPAQGGAIEHRGVRAGRYPRFVGAIPPLLRLIDGDVIYAAKPRPTSFGLGLLARLGRRRPLLLDVEDWELGFYYQVGFWHRVGRALNVGDPNGLAWTWLTERLVPLADAVTVASRFLERRFGGTLIPHVRDTAAWDPARYDRAAARALLGAGERKVLMFAGTPRGYKGVDDLIEAIRLLRREVLLVIIGADPASGDARRWASLPFVKVFGLVPFDDVPRYLVAADVVVVPQRATAQTVGQVPAKLIDAMALGRPIVSTAVSMIPEMLDGCGLVVPPGDVRALADAMERMVDDAAAAEALGRRARERCDAEYSFKAARAKLFPLVEAVAHRHVRP